MPIRVGTAAGVRGAALFLFALGCVLVSAQDRTVAFEDLAARAAAARDAGNVPEAIRNYQAAVQQKPSWEEGWWYLGTLNYDADRFADAIPAFRRTTELDPKLGPGWAFLGLCEFEMRQYREALDHLRKAQELGFAENRDIQKVALYHLALLLNANGRFEQAAATLVSQFNSTPIPEQITTVMGMSLLRIPLLPSQLDPSKDALVHSAGETAALLAANKFDDAFVAFTRMLQEYRGTPYLHYAFATALAAAGRYPEAQAQFREEARISPQSALPFLGLSSIALQLNQADDALTEAKRAVQLAPDSSEANEALARAHAALGQSQLADSAKARAKTLAESATAIEAAQVEFYSARGTNAASSTAPPVAESSGANFEFQAAIKEGESAQGAGRLEESANAYQRALSLRPDWSDGWRHLGTIAYMRGHYPEAVTALEKAVAAEAKQADAWTLLGLAEFETRDYRNSLLHLERGAALGFGGDAAAIQFSKYHLALLLILNGDFDRATDLLIPETGPGPLAEEIQFAMGLALLRMPALPEQVDSVHRPLVTKAGAAAVLLSQSRYDQAFPVFETLLQEFPATPFLHYAYGDALAAISEYDRAQAQLRDEIQLNAASPLPLIRLASIALTLHEPANAVAFAERAVRLAPSSPDAHYMLGRSALESGDTATAIRELEAARHLAPGSPAVHFNLARAYEKAQRPAEAEQERAEFERLNQRISSETPVQQMVQGTSRREGVGGALSAPPADR